MGAAEASRSVRRTEPRTACWLDSGLNTSPVPRDPWAHRLPSLPSPDRASYLTDRAIVAQFNIDYNTILANLCSQKGIFYDPDIYSYDFSRDDLSDVDCFHPAISAQEVFGALS